MKPCINALWLSLAGMAVCTGCASSEPSNQWTGSGGSGGVDAGSTGGSGGDAAVGGRDAGTGGGSDAAPQDDGSSGSAGETGVAGSGAGGMAGGGGSAGAGGNDAGDGDGSTDAEVEDGGAGAAGGGIPGEFKRVEAGSFVMGSPLDEHCRLGGWGGTPPQETQHTVTLSHPFEMMTTEVTQEHFVSVMGYNPTGFSECGASCPVDSLTWYEAAAYANALSAQGGLQSCYACSGSGPTVTCEVDATWRPEGMLYHCPGYRLPTEAEFEYALRAGTTTAFYGGVYEDYHPCDSCEIVDSADAIGWYAGNTGPNPGTCNFMGPPRPAGQKLPNAWGFYDLAGNVHEWLNDWMRIDLGSAPATDPTGPVESSGTTGLKMCRGGSWGSVPYALRSASRTGDAPEVIGGNYGFRCVRTLL